LNLPETLRFHNEAVRTAATAVDAARAAHDATAEATAVAELERAAGARTAFIRSFNRQNLEHRGSSFWRHS